MVKKAIPQKARKEITNYLNILLSEKLPISKVVVFGSVAKGNSNPWSDIDLCIVSPSFQDSWQATNYLWSKRKLTDVHFAIEPVGFSPQDFESEFDSLVQEIKKTGIEIPIGK